MHDYIAAMQDDFSQCLVLNTRMAARAITRRADRKLRPFGVTAAQFTIMTSLQSRPGLSVTEMAESIAMDRTTLSRNLDLLETKGVVASTRPSRANGRVCALTDAGRELVAQMLPVWRASQAELRETLVRPDFAVVITALQQLSRL
ncbi:MarR family winged helix-turn-helix transcriptional regulator [Devosia lacusdianchii]|jgi:DNA-binding MarR family transcriptional regulator|uniref:MarR family winged helix-turn-helix transcriptional regulator n=1 Tax=Devosia lacusdianchii TaxID=2917991 RepID=UPI001F06DF1F|nr:MarR family transcriptional regulator [Devosia sp. JXJ CY 41]